MNKIISNDKINLKLLFFKIRIHWYLFVIILFLFMAFAFLYNRSVEKMYEFKSILLLKSQRTGSKGPDEIMNLLNNLERKFNPFDEKAVISSLDLIRTTIDSLNFSVSCHIGNKTGKNEQYGDFPFRVYLQKKAKQVIDVPFFIEVHSANEFRVYASEKNASVYDFAKDEKIPVRMPELKLNRRAKSGELINGKNFNFAIFLSPDQELIDKYKNQKLHFIISNPQSVARSYQASLEAKVTNREGFLLELNTEGGLPKKEIDFLNQLMANYISQDVVEKNKKGFKTLDFINSQIKEAEQELFASELAVESFKSNRSLMDVESISRNTETNLDRLEDEKSKTEFLLQDYQSIHQYILKNENNDDAFIPANVNINDNFIHTMLQNLSLKLSRKATLKLSATDISPEMVKLHTEITNIRKTLQEYLQNNIYSTKAKLEDLNRRIASKQGRYIQLPQDDRTLLDLERALDFNKKKYENLLEKRTEAKIALETNAPDIRIIEKAKMVGGGPVKPNTRLIYMLSFLLGLFLPIGILIVQDLMSEKLEDKNQILALTKIPFLSMIASGKKNSTLAVLENPDSLVAESFRLLKIKLGFKEGSRHCKTIGITSTVNGEGKTFCSVNLSLAYALSHQKTLLISADLYKDDLQKYFPASALGLSTYLKQEAELDEIIQQTKIPNLHLINSGPLPLYPYELLNKENTEYLFQNLKQKYQFIFLDTPPLGHFSDYLLIKEYLDETIYVLRSRFSSYKYLNEVNELHENQVLTNIGIVFNDVKFSSTFGLEFKEKKNVQLAFSSIEG